MGKVVNMNVSVGKSVQLWTGSDPNKLADLARIGVNGSGLRKIEAEMVWVWLQGYIKEETTELVIIGVLVTDKLDVAKTVMVTDIARLLEEQSEIDRTVEEARKQYDVDINTEEAIWAAAVTAVADELAVKIVRDA